MTHSENESPYLKLKVSVVADDVTLRKIMRCYLQNIGLEETRPPKNGDFTPLAIFWLKK